MCCLYVVPHSFSLFSFSRSLNDIVVVVVYLSLNAFSLFILVPLYVCSVHRFRYTRMFSICFDNLMYFLKCLHFMHCMSLSERRNATSRTSSSIVFIRMKFGFHASFTSTSHLNNVIICLVEAQTFYHYNFDLYRFPERFHCFQVSIHLSSSISF